MMSNWNGRLLDSWVEKISWDTFVVITIFALYLHLVMLIVDQFVGCITQFISPFFR